jgi:hypothetical protein
MSLARLSFMIFILVGLLLLGISAYTYGQTTQFVKAAAEAEGEVVAMVSQGHSKYGTSVRDTPVVRFRTATNEQIQFTSNVTTSPPSHHMGEKVTVLYKRDAPNDPRISDFWLLWFAPVYSAGIGAVFIGIGALMFSPAAAALDRMLQRYREWRLNRLRL